MSVTIKYKGSAIAELTENGTKTLKTSGKYCEADIVVENTKDGGTQVMDGIIVKARDADGYATEVDFYGTDISRYQFGSFYGNDFGFKKIKTINLKNKITSVGSYSFKNCKYLTTLNGIDFGAITTLAEGAFSGTDSLELGEVNLTGLTSYGASYVFADCVGITKLHMHTDGVMHYGFVNNCPSLTEIVLDCVVKFTGGSSGNKYAALGRNTALTTCQIGNIGKACTATASGMFSGCTQTGLTITIYTTGSYADTALTNIRNGATNATIIIKAAEATTYNGTSYAAGDTIITSTV